MNKKMMLCAALVVALLSGCANADFSFGKDFDSSRVSQIAKGKTTSADLVAILGEPHAKSINADESERWVWTYSKGVSKATSTILTTNVKTTMHGKTLSVVIVGGVVQTYTYTEGPVSPAAMGGL